MMTQLSNGGYKVTPTLFKTQEPKPLDEKLIYDSDDLKIIMESLFCRQINMEVHPIGQD